MGSKARLGAVSVASVWFTTHFGGGFASGRQLVDFYVNYGWYALFMPFISVGIITAVLYLAWDYCTVHKIYDYREWGNSFFKPYQLVFSNLLEISYLTILLMATGVAFATGGTIVEQVLHTPYTLNTIAIAAVIFFLTIFGADLVRKAAFVMAIMIISGMLIIYTSNLFVNWPLLLEVVRQAPEPKGFWPALWQAAKYGGLQCSLLGAYIAVADGLNSREDVKKAAIYGFLMNGGVLGLASIGALAHYPTILAEKAPVLYITQHGGGGEFGVGIVSFIIVLAVISTGVGLIYGGTRRISNWWCKQTGALPGPKIDAVSSFIYVALSWGVASFGLIPLIAKGYVWIGALSIPFVVLPVIILGLKHRKKLALQTLAEEAS
ncbi:MAG: hypothetical protein KBH12_07840 [Synergistaceae bacterium]|nr:hypothetical protein [Synergistaceae bacterium]MBP9625964.1 hypothetical protein [Synergistaceae bacterium]MBP9958622.1 hypothetical protein [Synergistaceae bacterium]